MSGLLDLIINGLAALGIEWYESAFMGGLSQLPQTLLSFLLSYLVIQLFLFIFPPLRKLMLVLGMPFRYMHIWFHENAAKRIENRKYLIPTPPDRFISFWSENKGNDMKPFLKTHFSTWDAFKIATAPLLGAIGLFGFLIASSPILGGMGLFGLVLHLYLLFCCFGIMLPSLKDYSFIISGGTIRAGSLHPAYFLWTYLVFAFSGYIALKAGASAGAAFVTSAFYSVVYVVLLFGVSKIALTSNN